MEDIQVSETLLTALGFDLSDLSLGSALLVMFIIWIVRERILRKRVHSNGNGKISIIAENMVHIEKDIANLKDNVKNLYRLQEEHHKAFSDFRENFAKEMGELRGRIIK